ncbi:MAG: hypothetical protein IKQ97_10070, partial [Eubacterium sp.]|nr:hypothetical protein [Eubacterium sp.]
IEGNGGTNILGGGIYTTRTLLVGGKSLIRSNSAIEGGGIYLSAIDETMVCDLSGGTITGNIATNGGRGGGIYITSGDVHLAGSADLSAQATGSDDIHFAQFVSGSTPGAGCRFSHRYPTKSGYSFELHKDSPSGEDVTGMYWGEAGKILNDDTAFYVVWKYETPTSEPVITPTSIPTVVPSMPPVPTSTPVTSPAASIVPTETPAATETPIPSYGPGEGKDSEVHTSLSDKDKKLVDELVKKDGTISYPTAANMVLYARQNGITEKELLLTDKVIRSYKANTSLKGSTAGELSVKVIQVKKKSLTLKWKKQSKADGYRIYGNKKKKSKALKFIKSVKQGTFKKKITDLKKGTSYKYVIQAYRVIDGARMTVTVSAMVFGKTRKGKKQK